VERGAILGVRNLWPIKLRKVDFMRAKRIFTFAYWMTGGTGVNTRSE